MKFEINMRSGNAAFSDGNAPHETARILRETADRIDRGDTDGNLRDINGNTIGHFVLEIEDDDALDDADEADEDDQIEA